MSLVGTRPILPDELEQYELHHRARIAIKPGITGMWQVSGRSDITDFEEIVRLDTEYISEWNIGLDIKILFNINHIFSFHFIFSLEPLSRITSITRTVIPEIMERESPEQFLEILKLSFRRIRQRCP